MMKRLRQIAPLISVLIGCAPCFAKPALVVIDMQPFFAERWDKLRNPELFAESQQKLEVVLQSQIRLIRAAGKAGVPIVLVEYGKVGPIHPRILDEVRNAQPRGGLHLVKDRDGMFESATSEDALNRHFGTRGITDLVICGANGGACVLSSITGAMENGYNVWAHPNSIIDFVTRTEHPYHYSEKKVRSLTYEWGVEFNQPLSERAIELLFSDCRDSLAVTAH